MDITEPSPSAEPGVQLKPRRKRLSDAQDQADGPPPLPKPQRRSLSEVAQSDPEEPAPEPHPVSGRPRLSDAQPQGTPRREKISLGQSRVAVAEPPDNVSPSHADAGRQVPAPPDAAAEGQSSRDPAKIAKWIADLRAGQSLPIAAAGGLLAAAVGAMLWAVITVATNYQIGWMAVGVGCLVGGVVRILGRGIDKRFGYLGAGLALFGCLLGNYLTGCMFIAREVGMSATSVLTQINPAAIPRLMIGTFHPLDILFYGLAIYEGYRFSFRRISEADIGRILQRV